MEKTEQNLAELLNPHVPDFDVENAGSGAVANVEVEPFSDADTQLSRMLETKQFFITERYVAQVKGSNRWREAIPVIPQNGNEDDGVQRHRPGPIHASYEVAITRDRP